MEIQYLSICVIVNAFAHARNASGHTMCRRVDSVRAMRHIVNQA